MGKNTRTGQEERWFSVFLICFWITAFFSEGAYASYLTSLGYGEALIGRVMSSLGLASLFFMPAGGYLADRFSNYRALTAVCVCIVASMIWLVCWKPSVTVVYIFTVIGEEFGIIVGFLVIAFYMIFIVRGMLIAIDTDNTFDALVVFGCTTMLALQSFIIIGGVIKLIPLTGITLPFISAGGSSLISSLIMVGAIEGIAIKNGDRDESRVREIGGEIG